MDLPVNLDVFEGKQKKHLQVGFAEDPPVMMGQGFSRVTPLRHDKLGRWMVFNGYIGNYEES